MVAPARRASGAPGIPYFLIVFAADDPTVLGTMSSVPFSVPIGMPLRAGGRVELTEALQR